MAHIENRAHSTVVGFIPTGWYPSALALADRDRTFTSATARANQATPIRKGILSTGDVEAGSRSKHIHPADEQVGSVAGDESGGEAASLDPASDRGYALQGFSSRRGAHTAGPSIIPQRVGVSSEIKHVIYIIKENRTYDQEFGDLPHANGDPELTIFGEKITPNQHALAKEYVALDNLYCDGEVSMDGHSWSDFRLCHRLQ